MEMACFAGRGFTGQARIHARRYRFVCVDNVEGLAYDRPTIDNHLMIRR